MPKLSINFANILLLFIAAFREIPILGDFLLHRTSNHIVLHRIVLNLLFAPPVFKGTSTYSTSFVIAWPLYAIAGSGH